MSVRYVVTGGAGFVGSWLVESLKSKNPNASVLVIDDLSYGQLTNIAHLLDHRVQFVQESVNETDWSRHLSRETIVFHLAAIAPLPDCQADPELCYRVNFHAVIRLAEAARNYGVKKLILASTSAVYEADSEPPFSEKTRPNTILQYPTSKRFAEEILCNYRTCYNLPIAIVRLFNVYGYGADFLRKQPALFGYALKALLEKQVPTFFSDGTQKRDYIYIRDVIGLLEKASGYTGQEFIFNAASGISVSVLEIYQLIARCLNIKDFPTPHFENPCNFWNRYNTLFEGAFPLSKQRVEAEVLKYTLGSYAQSSRCLDWHPVWTMEEACMEIVTLYKQALSEGNNAVVKYT